ncbi:MAG: RdgB/HAM1 family non-canonical purine NTP pyrophosphatase [Gammaproteobacteria bacterium]
MLQAGSRIVAATGNPGKLAEIAAILQEFRVEVVSQGELGIGEVEETGLTFVENAILKARNAARLSERPAIADDSGLEVDALGGAPGIRSARYAGRGADDGANIDKLLDELAGVEQREAAFRCVMVFLRHAEDPSPLIAEGVWRGRILSERRGGGGFGYDPVFYDPESGGSVAELPAGEKNRISHRAQALRELARRLAADTPG